ncbi:MAG: hypothetical protein V4472_25475 [Pseudomonadota bacterium]
MAPISINGTNFYVKSLVDGLQSPYYAPVRAIVTNNIALPEQYTSQDTGGVELPVPFAFLFATTTTKHRQTAPRPMAWSARKYDFQILFSVIDHADAPNREAAFNCLCDALDIALSTTLMPLIITDPDTGWQSQIVGIGEVESTELFLPETIGDDSGSFLRYSYRCSHEIQERQNYASQPAPP